MPAESHNPEACAVLASTQPTWNLEFNQVGSNATAG